jgi:spoIIIJ-associated protein
MTKYIETTGRTEEEALTKALKELGMDRDEVSVEIIERAKSGFLGFGSTQARVRVSYEAPEEAPAAPVQADPAPQTAAPETPAPAAPQAPADSAPAGEDPKAERIRQFLVGLMAQMEVQASPEITVDQEGNYKVELVGSGLGAVIGRRGETLDAIQQLTGYAVNRGADKRVRVHLDAEHYRAKREESLQRLAVKTAAKAVKYRRNMVLEPMNAYERHVIHTALQDYPNVNTYSTGTEPNRRTVVAFAPGEHREG